MDRRPGGERGGFFRVPRAVVHHRAQPAAGARARPLPRVAGWMQRMRSFGHGRSARRSRRDRRSKSPPPRTGDAALVRSVSRRPAAWRQVRIRADDYGRDPIDGTLVLIDAQEIALAATMRSATWSSTSRGWGMTSGRFSRRNDGIPRACQSGHIRLIRAHVLVTRTPSPSPR